MGWGMLPDGPFGWRRTSLRVSWIPHLRQQHTSGFFHQVCGYAFTFSDRTSTDRFSRTAHLFNLKCCDCFTLFGIVD